MLLPNSASSVWTFPARNGTPPSVKRSNAWVQRAQYLQLLTVLHITFDREPLRKAFEEHHSYPRIAGYGNALDDQHVLIMSAGRGAVLRRWQEESQRILARNASAVPLPAPRHYALKPMPPQDQDADATRFPEAAVCSDVSADQSSIPAPRSAADGCAAEIAIRA